MPGGIIPPPAVYFSWPKPNYVDPVTQGPALMIVAILLSAIATLLVAARVYSRLFITRAPGIDDLLILISLAVSIAASVLVVVGNTKYGSGRHVWDLPPAKIVGYRVNLWASEWCYIVATCSVKISVLLFYRRLSSSFNRFFFVATWVGITYNMAYLIAFLFVIGFTCAPIKAYWLQVDLAWAATHEFTCTNEHISLPISAATSVLGDLYATLLPCILILKLDLPRRQKIALYSVFVLGFVVVAAGIIRTYFINYLINETYDNTWYLWKFWIWTLVELYISIIAASVPALKPFVRRFLVDPIISSRRDESSPSARDDPARSRAARGGQRKFWSNTSSTVPLGENGDVEKLGLAVAGDGTTKYELRTLPSGKVEPVLVHVGLPPTGVRPSDSPDRRVDPPEQSVWALPTTRLATDRCALRAYRAGIESLPPIPAPGRLAPVAGDAGGRRRGAAPPLKRRGRPHAPERGRSPALNRRASHDSVAVAPGRATSMRNAKAEAVAVRRVVGCVGEDADDSSDDYPASGASSSEETRPLSMHGRWDRDLGTSDETSHRLPRPGRVVHDNAPGRVSQVGLAV